MTPAETGSLCSARYGGAVGGHKGVLGRCRGAPLPTAREERFLSRVRGQPRCRYKAGDPMCPRCPARPPARPTHRSRRHRIQTQRPRGSRCLLPHPALPYLPAGSPGRCRAGRAAADGKLSGPPRSSAAAPHPARRRPGAGRRRSGRRGRGSSPPWPATAASRRRDATEAPREPPRGRHRPLPRRDPPPARPDPARGGAPRPGRQRRALPSAPVGAGDERKHSRTTTYIRGAGSTGCGGENERQRKRWHSRGAISTQKHEKKK